MLVWTILSLFEMNQESVNGLFMQLQGARLPTDCVLLFYSGINRQKGDVTIFI